MEPVTAADRRPFRTPTTRDDAGVLHTGPLPADDRPAARLNRWPPTARLYEPLWRHRSLGLLTLGAFGTDRELAAMTAWLATSPGLRILDVGCGAGFYLRALHGARADLDLHGVDASPAFLREAARTLDRASVPATLVHADAAGLPYNDATFDGAACGGTPNEFRDPSAAFQEIARVVRPGGHVWLMAQVAARTWPARFGQALARTGGLWIPATDDVVDRAETAGLRPVRVEERGPVLLGTFVRST